jgi:hypothetical protein
VKTSRRGPLWVIGWREWLALPELGISEIKAKIDTGARSSALHAFHVERFRRRGKAMVRFGVHPLQRDASREVLAEAELIDERRVRSSAGEVQLRPVVVTSVKLHERVWRIELTLTNRDEMGFRMLLGRQALRGRFVIDPGGSFLAGKPRRAKAAMRST